MLKLSPYSTDAESSVLYLSNPRPIAVQYQITEVGDGLLDMEVLVNNNGGGQSKFLLRMEGTQMEMRVFAEAILVAMKHPRPHPFPGDLFEDALIDRSDSPEPLRTFYLGFRQSKSEEVDLARAGGASVDNLKLRRNDDL